MCVYVTIGVTGVLLNLFSAAGQRGPRGAVANEDLLRDARKRTRQAGYLLFSLWFAFIVVHVLLLLTVTCISCFSLASNLVARASNFAVMASTLLVV